MPAPREIIPINDTAVDEEFHRPNRSCSPPRRGADALSCSDWTRLTWSLAALLLLVAAVPGCRGCRDPLIQRDEKLKDLDEEEEKKKKKAERKADFEIRAAITVPGEGADEGRPPLAKPGHWISVHHEVRANNFNFAAELHTAATDANGSIFPVEDTQFALAFSRPAPLPQGQLKVFETAYFVPRLSVRQNRSVWLNRELRALRGGRQIGQPDRLPTAPMRSYQYYFVVLAGNPDRYGYLKRLTSVASPTAVDLTHDNLLFYRVLLPKLDRIVPLPAHSLTWSSVAYLLWDDLDAAMFTSGQQTALLDWLHWGGQLIVSGPNSLDKLQGSFLEPYLPARTSGAMEIDQAAIDEINQNWSLPKAESQELRALKVAADSPLIGVRMSADAAADVLPNTGGLVIERRVGRGRIVVTAFSLAERAIVNWPSYDSFFNACLLRRPRRFFQKKDLVADAYWADYHPSLAGDSRFVTTLRYFSRDIGHLGGPQDQGESAGVEPEDIELLGSEARLASGRPADGAVRPPPSARNPDANDWHFQGYPLRSRYGMAAWNDRSGAADAAREALRDAAGISIPRGSFVLQVLAIYLFVLAPLNWAFFRLLGRVEWAWIAAPLIAIVAAFAVIRTAQLDIGFARSLTEIAIAEIQPGYPRAHVTRYTALYTSLSTSYEVAFNDPNSLVQPFATSIDQQRWSRDGFHTVNLRRERGLTLNGFRVPSNKTGILHSEQFSDLGGSFQILGDEAEGIRLQNETELTLRSAGVLRRLSDGRLEAAWIGDLQGGTTVPLQFVHLANGVPHFEQWDQSATTISLKVQSDRILSRLDSNRNGVLEFREVESDLEILNSFERVDRDRDRRWAPDELRNWCRRSRAGEVSLGQLLELACRRLRLLPGDVRLVGWTEQAMPQRNITPMAAQADQRTLVLAHLRRAPLPEPLRDVNCRADVIEIDPAALDDPEAEWMDGLPEDGNGLPTLR